MSVFRLPDLGEGLADAEIVSWHVAVGDEVRVDQPLVSVETAKAVVEVPAPQAGRIKKLHGAPGDRIETGGPLVEFEGDEAGDGGTVVGHMPEGGEYAGLAAGGGAAAELQRVRAVPAARALARSLGVDLRALAGSGTAGLITLDDVIRTGLPAGAANPPVSTMRPPVPQVNVGDTGEVQPLRSLRRAMAHSMTLARDSVMECTVSDDADLHAWQRGNDYTSRTLRAIAVACRKAPGLNAWYDEGTQSRRIFEQVDVGIAVDAPDGLIVPVLRDVGRKDSGALRAELDRLKRAAHERSLKPAELANFTIILSNFGMMAGRYASPVVVPPTVAILGTGRVRDDVVAADGQVAIHRRMPLSLSFDHRVVTGGEAVRFLGAVIEDLAKAN